jgi:hypothetical protein
MNDLLQAVLNDTASREDTVLPALAADIAEKFLPWANVD